ncbi:hypothetical protein [Novipirellula caenicola]|uniref:Uncharacterized protein n=1 Tax=Novipirellula caenicola TaxID=1536901 RepID=A0ABP9VPA1_9BACT
MTDHTDPAQANLTSVNVSDIDARFEAIRYAMKRAAEFGSDVSWRDLLPPEFFGNPKFNVTLNSERLNGLQIGDLGKYEISAHGSINNIGKTDVHGEQVQHKTR